MSSGSLLRCTRTATSTTSEALSPVAWQLHGANHMGSVLKLLQYGLLHDGSDYGTGAFVIFSFLAIVTSGNSGQLSHMAAGNHSTSVRR